MRRVPLGLIGMLALVAAVEAFVATKADRLARFENWAWSHAARAAKSEAPSCEVLSFGDSLVMMGVVPSLLGSNGEPPRPAYNLAVPGGQAPTSYFLLRRAIEAGARPKAVVVDFMPTLLDCEIFYNDLRWPELLDPRDALELAWDSGEPRRFASSLVPQWLPTLRARPAIREAIVGVLGGNRPSRRASRQLQLGQDANRRNLETNDGALVALASIARPSADDVRKWYANSYPRPWVCRPLSELYVRKFLALAESRGIVVFWLLPPLLPEAMAMEDERGDATRYAKFVAKMAADSPNLVVLDARGSGYGREAFLDVIHLERRGAIALSAEIGRALTVALDRPGDGPRWVDLGPYRERPAPLIQDTAASLRQVVRARVAGEAIRR